VRYPAIDNRPPYGATSRLALLEVVAAEAGSAEAERAGFLQMKHIVNLRDGRFSGLGSHDGGEAF